MSVTVVTEIVILGRLGKNFHFYEVNGSENSLPHEVISKKNVQNTTTTNETLSKNFIHIPFLAI